MIEHSADPVGGGAQGSPLDASSTGSSRLFWAGYAVGWLAIFAIILTIELTQGSSTFPSAAGLISLFLAPPVLSTWFVAYHRRRLLRTEWGFWKTLSVHKVVGVTFAFTLAISWEAIFLTGWLEPSSEAVGMSAWARLLFNLLPAAFIYMAFFGFLIWTESIRRVHVSQAIVAREAILRAEAEAKAVRAQFNPHFVFNTLHSLMLLVRADPAAAERAIEDVATLIRYASIIQRRDIDAVPMAKEVEVARRYLALEQLRLGPRLEVTWSVAEDTRDLVVPAFALQTLVENAVKHGIEPKEDGGRISVTVELGKNALMARVQDNGAGADPGVVGKSGHGLELLARRLGSRYGDAASVRWETEPGGGFTTVLELPAERIPPEADLDVIEERDEHAAVGSGAVHG